MTFIATNLHQTAACFQSNGLKRTSHCIFFDMRNDATQNCVIEDEIEALVPVKLIQKSIWLTPESGSSIAKKAQSPLTGKPFNIASYALLTMMVAQVCDLEVGEFVHTLGDAHIYSNHFEQVKS